MGEILPDGSIQGYFKSCGICGRDVSVNIQGNGKCEICSGIRKGYRHWISLASLDFENLSGYYLCEDEYWFIVAEYYTNK